MLEWLTLYWDPLLKATGLFLLFACFHTICAQIWFKNILAKLLSPFFVEYFWRIIYVLISLKLYFGLAMPFLYENMPQGQLFTMTDFSSNVLGYVARFGNWCFILVLVQIDFLYYFGIKQMIRGSLILLKVVKANPEPIKYTLKTNYFYGVVRHPLYFALLMMMSPSINNVSGLIAYSLIVLYLLIGLPIEERKLIKQFGEDYIAYQKSTPMFIPLMKVAMWKKWLKHA